MTELVKIVALLVLLAIPVLLAYQSFRVYKERLALVRDLDAARIQGRQWRDETRVLLKGLGEAIARQFLAWRLTEAERELEYERAIDLLHGALLQRPDFLFPYINLAVIQADHGDYAAADRNFRRAAELNPRYRVTRELWAKMLEEQGRTEEALAQVVAAVEIDKRDPKLRNWLGQLYQQVGRADLAQVQFQRAVQLNPREPEYLRNWRSIAAVAQ